MKCFNQQESPLKFMRPLFWMTQHVFNRRFLSKYGRKMELVMVLSLKCVSLQFEKRFKVKKRSFTHQLSARKYWVYILFSMFMRLEAVSDINIFICGWRLQRTFYLRKTHNRQSCGISNATHCKWSPLLGTSSFFVYLVILVSLGNTG